ncbi:MAG: large subunit ribosomal protein L15 [Gammaproteobacteria bacterium]|jgi:large subunit ribosomal protein L15
MRLNTIKSADNSRPSAKRVGRGPGSGVGKTAGRGVKGQKARSGGYHKRGFEGGQMPLNRRLPKRGFSSRVNRHAVELRLDELNGLDASNPIDIEALIKARIIPGSTNKVKAILSGEVTQAVTLKGISATKGAREAIEKAGGKLED